MSGPFHASVALPRERPRGGVGGLVDLDGLEKRAGNRIYAIIMLKRRVSGRNIDE